MNGAKLHYLSWNFNASDKPVLLFVHGFRAHAHWWQHLAPFFQQHYRVVAMSLSGMGDSDFRDAYTASTFSDDIIGLLDNLQVQNVRTVAHSFGCSRVVKAAAERPDLFEQLVMVDSDYRFDNEPPLVRKTPHQSPKIYPSRAAIEARFRLIPEQPIIFPDVLAHILKHSICELEAGARWKFDPRIASFSAASLTMDDYSPRLHLPVDFVYGTNSGVVEEARISKQFALLPQGRHLHAIPGGYHHLMLDQPTALLSVLQVLLN